MTKRRRSIESPNDYIGIALPTLLTGELLADLMVWFWVLLRAIKNAKKRRLILFEGGIYS